MLAELHSHTTFSKMRGKLTEGMNCPEEMILHAKRIGLDAIAITDHDVIDGNLGAQSFAKKNGMILIPAAELSTTRGHVVALGIQELPKHKISGKKFDFYEALDFIREQGGISVAAHPFDAKNEGVGNLCLKCDAIEIFNALNIEHISNWKASWLVKQHGFRGVTAASDALGSNDRSRCYRNSY
jgi:predicted metal-dependent phosphoesterase TrpH